MARASAAPLEGVLLPVPQKELPILRGAVNALRLLLARTSSALVPGGTRVGGGRESMWTTASRRGAWELTTEHLSSSMENSCGSD